MHKLERSYVDAR